MIQIWRLVGPNVQAFGEIGVSLAQAKDKSLDTLLLGDPVGRYTEVTWGRFKKLMKELGYTRRLAGPSECGRISRTTTSAMRARSRVLVARENGTLQHSS